MSEGGASPERLRESLDELRGLSEGILADQKLSDGEILFLQGWLERHDEIATAFPGNVVHKRIRDVLEDGIITGEEREYLIGTLTLLVEGNLDDLAGSVELTELWFDQAGRIEFDRARFCLTGNFVYGSAEACRSAIEERGGIVNPEVSPEANFLVVGGLGVDEWRQGGLGAEIEAAMRLREQGVPLKIIPEDAWAASP